MSPPRHSIFISYRRRETAFAVDQLDRALKHAFGDDAVFRDVRSIRKGHDFPGDIRAALGEARVGLVVIGPWWLSVGEDINDTTSQRRLQDPQDWVRIEVESLLRRELAPGQPIPVIPLFTGGAAAPPAVELPESLEPLATRDGLTFDPYPDTDHSIERIIAHLATIIGVTPQPFAAAIPAVDEQPPRVSSPRLSVTGKKFVGREQELHLLDEAWGRSAGDKINIVSLIGQGGEGKTALVLQWYSRRARHGWQGARRVFDWSFYSQGTSDQSSASADEFFNAAFAWFGHTGEVPKDAWAKGGKLAELIAAERTLLVLDGLEPLQQPPGGFGGEFKHPAMKALLRGLALNNPGLCILTSRTDITDLANFEHADGSCLRHPLHSLDATAARALLRELGVLGPAKELDEAIEWFHRHAYDVNLLGNYLAKCTTDHDIRGWQQRFPLLKEDERIHPVPDAAGKRAGHGRRMLRAYERWLGPVSPATAILRLLGLFDRPVRSDLLDELRAAPIIPGLADALVPLPDDEWLATLDQLQELALISREPMLLPAETAETQGTGRNKRPKAKRSRRSVTYAVDCHPLLREHFAAELRDQHPDARREGHRRLYKYLCATTPDKAQPTLEDLQPLYQAVAHGCQAELQQEACENVYIARVLRGNENYSAYKLGAFGSDLGAVACFFETPWSRVSPALTEPAQAWLLAEAAFRLRALGRLTEALQPMRAVTEMTTRLGDWKNAAIDASNLSELELTLGEVAGALGDAEQSVIYADRSGDAFSRKTRRARTADALHLAGRRSEAETRFREAEDIHAKNEPGQPLLYTLSGFQYCDLLLSEAERGAWQTVLASGGREPAGSPRPVTGASETPVGSRPPLALNLVHACRDVEQRAAKTLKWAESMQKDILSASLDHVSLGRAAFYAAILGRAALPLGPNLTDAPQRVPTEDELATPRRELDAAVSGLRRSGNMDDLPRGLLTRAWLRFVAGKRTGSESAQSDLDEAWEIAERGSMKLHMADIHLYRARLFGRPAVGECGSVGRPATAQVGESGSVVRPATARSVVRPATAQAYPWDSPAADLAAAETLINACGYHRRDEELADAKAALLPA